MIRVVMREVNDGSNSAPKKPFCTSSLPRV